MRKVSLVLLVCVFIIVQLLGNGQAWGSDNDERVMLDGVRVITLKQGARTNGRRSAPVDQLRCVGGTARCEFQPRVVQCYNRGSDGNDIQWECKTDMSNKYRFGQIVVSCEGYNYPDDPYILKGSCGLEYEIDFTEEGLGHQSSNQYHKGHDYGWKPYVYDKNQNGSKLITNLACSAVVVVIIYAIYKTCISPNVARQRSTTDDDYNGRGPGSAPPPPGFRQDFYSSNSNTHHRGHSSGFDDSCSGSGTQHSANAGQGFGMGRNAGGFWTGAAAGGLLGYMFGARNNNETQYGGATYRPRPSTSWGSTGGGFGGGTYTSGSSSSSSSGSRTASGFGGTSRR